MFKTIVNKFSSKPTRYSSVAELIEASNKAVAAITAIEDSLIAANDAIESEVQAIKSDINSHLEEVKNLDNLIVDVEKQRARNEGIITKFRNLLS